MTIDDQTLGELELEILKIIWEEQPCIVSGVAEMMVERRGIARTTVLTVMQRLMSKGFIKRRRKDGVYHYSPTQNKKSVMGRLVRQFVDGVLDGSPAMFVAYLAESGDLTPAQLRTLKSMAKDLEKDGE